jgi:opacity protein-like surface antigen
MQKMLMAAVMLAGISGQALAATDLYSTAGLQYSRTGEPYDLSDSGYQLGLGYVINSQWSAELTAEQLFDKEENEDGMRVRLDTTALTLAVLGKTSVSDALQLYYRAGVSQLNHQADVTINNKTSSADDTQLHALLGLGLEQNFNERWFGRAEVVHLFKKDDLQADTFRLSLGYRF